MNQEQDQLFREFEKEVWLYLDKDLPETRIQFWNAKLKEIPELNKCIEDYLMISNTYNNATYFDISEQKFNSIIKTATSKISFWKKIKIAIAKIISSETEFAFGKAAFAGVLIIAAITISIFSSRPDHINKKVKTFNSEILDWNGSYIESEISKISNSLKFIADDDYKKYSKYKIKTQNVSKNISLIENDILELKKEIINSEL